MRAVRPADVLTGVGSAALLIAMFLPWYRPRGRSEGINAWEAFTVTDLLTVERFDWRLGGNYVRLDPGERAGHLLRADVS